MLFHHRWFLLIFQGLGREVRLGGKVLGFIAVAVTARSAPSARFARSGRSARRISQGCQELFKAPRLDSRSIEAAGYVALSRVQHDADWQCVGWLTPSHFQPAVL